MLFVLQFLSDKKNKKFSLSLISQCLHWLSLKNMGYTIGIWGGSMWFHSNWSTHFQIILRTDLGVLLKLILSPNVLPPSINALKVTSSFPVLLDHHHIDTISRSNYRCCLFHLMTRDSSVGCLSHFISTLTLQLWLRQKHSDIVYLR